MSPRMVRPRRGLSSLPVYSLTITTLLISSAGCGGVRTASSTPATSCKGLSCALLTPRKDLSCPQNSGLNKRTYASATQANLTVFFFYELEQYDGAGNLTVFPQQTTLAGTAEVPLSCDYDVKGGTQYQYDIVKQCATTRVGATLSNCTTEESNLVLNSERIGALAVRTSSHLFDPAKLLQTPSSCVDICKLQSSSCLRVPFTQDQTKDLDGAMGILFGHSSKNDLKGCSQTIEVNANGPNNRLVNVTGTDNACIIDINSRVGQLEIFVPKGTKLNNRGNLQKYAMAPTTDDTAFIKLPFDDWQKRYGGRIEATEGTQASTVITTENGCVRLDRFH